MQAVYYRWHIVGNVVIQRLQTFYYRHVFYVFVTFTGRVTAGIAELSRRFWFNSTAPMLWEDTIFTHAKVHANP